MSHLLLWVLVHAGVNICVVSFFFLASDAAAELAFKRKLSLPVSRMWQRWVRQSSKAVVILASLPGSVCLHAREGPKTVAHSLKLRPPMRDVHRKGLLATVVRAEVGRFPVKADQAALASYPGACH